MYKRASTALLRYLIKNKNRLPSLRYNKLLLLASKRVGDSRLGLLLQYDKEGWSAPFRSASRHDSLRFPIYIRDKNIRDKYWSALSNAKNKNIAGSKYMDLLRRLKANEISLNFLSKTYVPYNLDSMLATEQRYKDVLRRWINGKAFRYSTQSAQPILRLPYRPDDYFYSAKKYRAFLNEYENGRPLWGSRYPRVAINYTVDPSEDLVFQLRRNKLKHQGNPIVLTPHTSVGSYKGRLKARLRSLGLIQDQTTSDINYLGVFDNTSGYPSHMILRVYKKNPLDNQLYEVNWRILPNQMNKKLFLGRY